MAVVNDSWETTEDRLKGRGKISYYEIGASRLTETGNEPYGRELYDWPIQNAGKGAFNYEHFVEAYREALEQFAGQYQPTVDPDVLERSIEKGREMVRSREL